MNTHIHTYVCTYFRASPARRDNMQAGRVERVRDSREQEQRERMRFVVF